ncbi:hypothetical protein HQ45_07430 [Porphyromonas crevioricanis]|nr:hypothetical protein HQ45_07430 [Porphyromonas crevioricanis]KGN93538.1 hypothetical protein HQ38_08880 [Porphyromonas crevioricanis]GAD04350.1 hypothetical protein PORCRE_33 [Porphyromonas crevioricanis JCM 15906]GAD07773.1 hypothetical protein PORCAN_1400 [Porphyromonas crevioricanis JCM 13913]
MASVVGVSAQKVAIKNNLAYDLTATPNLSLEVGLSPKVTFDLTGGFNPFKMKKVLDNDMQWRHWLIQPEFRYWFCERFNGTFVGLHGLGGQMNFGGIQWPLGYLTSNYIWDKNPEKNEHGQFVPGKDPDPFKDADKYRYQGWYVGAGLSVGYQWILSNHWNFEASIGGGYVHLFYDKSECKDCGAKLYRNQEADYFGLTRATLSIVYLFR